MPCLICMTALPMDDEQSRVGVVGWRIAFNVGPRLGTAVSFECPNGHSSNDDPELLKAFPRRRFWEPANAPLAAASASGDLVVGRRTRTAATPPPRVSSSRWRRLVQGPQKNNETVSTGRCAARSMGIISGDLVAER